MINFTGLYKKTIINLRKYKVRICTGKITSIMQKMMR